MQFLHELERGMLPVICRLGIFLPMLLGWARALCPVVPQLCLPGAALHCDLGVIPVDITFSTPQEFCEFPNSL